MSEVKVCDNEALRPGDVHTALLTPDHHGRPREALLIRDAEGKPRAYLNRCQHLPIPLDCGSRDFLDDTGTQLICVTHGATYRLDDGHCTWGPCKGSSLQALAVIERDGGLYVVDPDDPRRGGRSSNPGTRMEPG